jgi:hypothetical protein
MPRKTQQEHTEDGQLRSPVGVVLRPPVSIENLKTDTENDPEGAEEFVALIRDLRSAGSRPIDR